MSEETVHSKLSPSGSKRWMTCSGSIKFTEALMQEGLIKADKPTKYAAEGTVAHEIGEKCLVSTSLEPADFLGKKMKADGFTFTVNKDMTDAVEEYVDYVENCITETSLHAETLVEKYVEVWCSLKFYNIPGMEGGTSDTVLISKDQCLIHVIDYKHGAGVSVEVKNNTQAMMYGLGALLKLIEEGIISEKDLEHWTVKMTIVQPRAFHPDGGIRSDSMGAVELFKWGAHVLVPAAKKTQDTNYKKNLVASEDSCRFCPCKSQCPKIIEHINETAMVEFDSLDNEPKLPETTSLTSEQKISILQNIDIVRSFLVAVEEQVRNEIDQGSKDYQDAFKLVRKQSRRKFTEDAFDPDFSPLFDHLEEDDLHVKKQESLTNVEKALKKKLGTKIALEIMDEVTTKPEGDLVVAPLSDRRKAVNPTVISDFSDLD